MTVGARSRRRPRSRKAKIIGLTVGAILIWQVVAISLAAGHGDYVSDLAAANYSSTSPAAAVAAAAQHLQDNDPAGAEIFAKQALRVSPISAASLRDLGLAEQELGRWQLANALLSQVAALGWRDAPTQLWLAQAHLQAKDYSQAAQRFDALLRIQPYSTPLYDLLDQAFADKALAAAMAGRLVLNPNWRDAYLRYPGNGSALGPQARAGLLNDLARTSSPPSRAEILPTVRGLIQSNQATAARMLWFEAQHVRSGALYDPTFEQVGTVGTIPFEWTVKSVLGANVGAVQGDPGQKAVLNVTTDGSASGTLMHQLTMLTPGRHILSYTGSPASAIRGTFGWSVRCASTGKSLLDTVSDASPMPYSFEVPDGCDQQYVELRTATGPSAAAKTAHFYRLDVQ